MHEIVEQRQFLESRSATVQILFESLTLVELLNILQHLDHSLLSVEQVSQAVGLHVEEGGGGGEQ